MNMMKAIKSMLPVLALGAAAAQATVYTDATEEARWNAKMDIYQVEVTNNATNLSFEITFAEPGLTSDEWARFAVAIDSVEGGVTNANAWNSNFYMSTGMDYFGGGWTAQGTNTSGVNFYDASLGDWPEDVTNQTSWIYYWGAAVTSNSVSYSVPLATLGLAGGDSFEFDIYTFWDAGEIEDALSSASQITADGFDSGTNGLTYTVESVYGDPATAYISVDGANVVIEFLAENNVIYYVQAADSLSPAWSNASPLIVGDGTTNSTSYPADDPTKFFRVIQP